VLITNALQPAEIEEVILCQMLGRAIVLVREDQLSLAIGRRGQNVRLASKLCGWDIEIMTRDELEEQIERAVSAFSSMEGVSDDLAEALVGEGYLSYDDLSVIEPDALMEMGGMSAEEADAITTRAEEKALAAERAAATERRRQREIDSAERQAEEAAQQADDAARQADELADEAAEDADAERDGAEMYDASVDDTQASGSSEEEGEPPAAADEAGEPGEGELAEEAEPREAADEAGPDEEIEVAPPQAPASEADAAADSEVPSPADTSNNDAALHEAEPARRDEGDAAAS
jgi:N utilization substance protein A